MLSSMPFEILPFREVGMCAAGCYLVSTYTTTSFLARRLWEVYSLITISCDCLVGFGIETLFRFDLHALSN